MNDVHILAKYRSAQYFRKDIASAKALRYRGGKAGATDESPAG
jgi:hypothetical protein